MINKLAEDIEKRYWQKLAALEKDASKWARETARRLGDDFTFEDYQKMYNYAYTTDDLYGKRYDTQIAEPNAAGYISHDRYNYLNAEKKRRFREMLENKVESLPEGSKARAQAINIANNYYRHFHPEFLGARFVNNADFKVKPHIKNDLPYNYEAPASEFFGFTDEFFNPGTKANFEKEYGRPESVSEAFGRIGGKNPYVKGLTTDSPISNSNRNYSGGKDNKILREIGSNSLPDWVSLRQQFEGMKRAGKYDGLHTNMLSGYWPVATWYADNNNFSVANLNNVWSDLKNMDIEVQPSPNIGYQNLEERALFSKAMQNYYNNPQALRMFENEGAPNFWRKSEVAIPKNLVDKLDAHAFHVYDPENPTRSLRMGDVFKTSVNGKKPESAYNMKNWLQSEEAKKLQAIPLNSYNAARQDMQNFLVNNVAEMQQNGKKLFGDLSPKYISKNYDFLDMLRNSGIQVDKINWLKPFLKVRR